MERRFPEYGPNHPLNKLPDTAFRNNDFEPKMSFEQRCTVLAYHIRGVSIAQLAAAYGVNRRTISKIVDLDSGRYQRVKDELKSMGEGDFLKRYLTEEGSTKIGAARAKPEVNQSRDQYDRSAADRSRVASPRANMSKGINTIKSEHHEYSHRIEIDYLDANTAEDANGPFEHPAGWYWRDLDGEMPNQWQGDPEGGHHLSSTKALEHAKANA